MSMSSKHSTQPHRGSRNSRVLQATSQDNPQGAKANAAARLAFVSLASVPKQNRQPADRRLSLNDFTQSLSAARSIRAGAGFVNGSFSYGGNNNNSSNGSNGTGNGKPPASGHAFQPANDPEPLDDNITELVRQMEEVEPILIVLRSELMLYATLAYDGSTFTDHYDAHLRQLGRVIYELKRMGKCRIRGRLVVPGSGRK